MQQKPAPSRIGVIVVIAVLTTASLVFELALLSDGQEADGRKTDVEAVGHATPQAQADGQAAEADTQAMQQNAAPPDGHRQNEAQHPHSADGLWSDEMLWRDDLRNGLAYAEILRAETTIYFAERGRLPADMQALDFEAAPMPSALKKTDIENGRITLHFVLHPQLEGSVTLTPQTDTRYPAISGWDCTTHDFPFIGEVRPGCRYLAR